MGDISEYLDSVGLDAWILHKAGECDLDCQYCYDDALKESRYNAKLDKMLDNFDKSKKDGSNILG